jgi:hypothetical protein
MLEGGLPMKRIILAVAAVILSGSAITALALDPSDYMGLTPDQMQGVIENQRAYDQMQLQMIIEQRRQEQEAIRERNRQQEYSNRNPYSQCLSLGEVIGTDIEDAKTLGRKLGGDTIQYVETTAKYVKANIYKCVK